MLKEKEMEKKKKKKKEVIRLGEGDLNNKWVKIHVFTCPLTSFMRTIFILFDIRPANRQKLKLLLFSLLLYVEHCALPWKSGKLSPVFLYRCFPFVQRINFHTHTLRLVRLDCVTLPFLFKTILFNKIMN